MSEQGRSKGLLFLGRMTRCRIQHRSLDREDVFPAAGGWDAMWRSLHFRRLGFSHRPSRTIAYRQNAPSFRSGWEATLRKRLVLTKPPTDLRGLLTSSKASAHDKLRDRVSPTHCFWPATTFERHVWVDIALSYETHAHQSWGDVFSQLAETTAGFGTVGSGGHHGVARNIEGF